MNLLTCLLPPQEVKALARTMRRRAWGRAYYRDKRKPLQAAYERSVLERDRARRNAARVRRYWRNAERERAASRERMNALNARRRLIFSHGMTTDELIDWNISIGQITMKQAKAIRQREVA